MLGLEWLNTQEVVDLWFIGNSEEIKKAQKFILLSAKSLMPLPVLLTWETWTWKEIAAKIIHQLSNRNEWPFIAINCAWFNEWVIESELFWHEKWAFSWAQNTRKWLFELANSWTILLDEIWDMPISTQAKLLRVLQDGTYYKVWWFNPEKTDVRIISATNKDLNCHIKRWIFKHDLFHRIWIDNIVLPPLRERNWDLILLADYFINETRKKIEEISWNSTNIEIDNTFYNLILKYPWPWNIRELKWFIDWIINKVTLPELNIKIITKNVALQLYPFISEAITPDIRGNIEPESNQQNNNELEKMLKSKLWITDTHEQFYKSMINPKQYHLSFVKIWKLICIEYCIRHLWNWKNASIALWFNANKLRNNLDDALLRSIKERLWNKNISESDVLEISEQIRNEHSIDQNFLNFIAQYDTWNSNSIDKIKTDYLTYLIIQTQGSTYRAEREFGVRNWNFYWNIKPETLELIRNTFKN